MAFKMFLCSVAHSGHPLCHTGGIKGWKNVFTVQQHPFVWLILFREVNRHPGQDIGGICGRNLWPVSDCTVLTVV